MYHCDRLIDRYCASGICQDDHHFQQQLSGRERTIQRHHIGFDGCSSHSVRHTFLTNAARKISTVGGSLRDVQMRRYTNLQATQRYIEANPEAQMKIVELV